MTSINMFDMQSIEYLTKERMISYYNQARIIRSLGKYVKNLLEVGIFNSLFTELLRRNGYNVTTADVDANLTPDIILDLAGDFSLPSNKFDAIVLFQVLEHISYEEAEKALKNLANTTKKFVVISLPYRSIFFSIQLKFSITTRPRYLFIHIPRFWSQKPLCEEHYWEIGLKDYPKQRIVNSIEQAGLVIKREYIDPLNPYHYFFVMEKREQMSS